MNLGVLQQVGAPLDIYERPATRFVAGFIGNPPMSFTDVTLDQQQLCGDGFAIRQGLWPGYVGPFVEQVIPLLQQRGVARSEYDGTTLREHLREF